MRFLWLLPLLGSCGPLPQTPFDTHSVWPQKQSIIHGQPCSREDHPSAVAILVDADLDTGGAVEKIHRPICTGTLIAPDAVLTAAHCLDSVALAGGRGTIVDKQYAVTFQADLVSYYQDPELPFPTDTVVASRYVQHPSYDLDLFGDAGLGEHSDIALLFLQNTTIAPAAIVLQNNEAQQVQEGREVEIAGWGRQTHIADPNEPPPLGTVGVKHCATSFVNRVATYEIQIGHLSDTSRKCHGDSGGPTYMQVDGSGTHRHRVIGVTSHAYDAQECAKGSADTRVSAYLPWLDAVLRDACEDNSRAWCQVPGLIPASYYSDPPTKRDPVPQPEQPSCGCSAGQCRDSSMLLWFLVFAVVWSRRR